MKFGKTFFAKCVAFWVGPARCHSARGPCLLLSRRDDGPRRLRRPGREPSSVAVDLLHVHRDGLVHGRRRGVQVLHQFERARRELCWRRQAVGGLGEGAVAVSLGVLRVLPTVVLDR